LPALVKDTLKEYQSNQIHMQESYADQCRNLNNWPEGILVKTFFATRNATNNDASSFDKKITSPSVIPMFQKNNFK